MLADKRELIRAALKVLSAHVDRRRADPKDISLLSGAASHAEGLSDAELARSIIEEFLRDSR